MFENIMRFFKKLSNKNDKTSNSKEAAKERLHLVLVQDRANVSADFLELMKQEIIEVIKKYIDVDEGAIDVRLTNKENSDGTNGAPALYANIPIVNIKNDARKIDSKDKKENKDDNKEDVKEELKEEKAEIKEQEQEKEQDKEENKNEKADEVKIYEEKAQEEKVEESSEEETTTVETSDEKESENESKEEEIKSE